MKKLWVIHVLGVSIFLFTSVRTMSSAYNYMPPIAPLVSGALEYGALPAKWFLSYNPYSLIARHIYARITPQVVLNAIQYPWQIMPKSAQNTLLTALTLYGAYKVSEILGPLLAQKIKEKIPTLSRFGQAQESAVSKRLKDTPLSKKFDRVSQEIAQLEQRLQSYNPIDFYFKREALEKELNHLRALEGQLQDAITDVEKIRDAAQKGNLEPLKKAYENVEKALKSLNDPARSGANFTNVAPGVEPLPNKEVMDLKRRELQEIGDSLLVPDIVEKLVQEQKNNPSLTVDDIKKKVENEIKQNMLGEQDEARTAKVYREIFSELENRERRSKEVRQKMQKQVLPELEQVFAKKEQKLAREKEEQQRMVAEQQALRQQKIAHKQEAQTARFKKGIAAKERLFTKQEDEKRAFALEEQRVQELEKRKQAEIAQARAREAQKQKELLQAQERAALAAREAEQFERAEEIKRLEVERLARLEEELKRKMQADEVVRASAEAALQQAVQREQELAALEEKIKQQEQEVARLKQQELLALQEEQRVKEEEELRKQQEAREKEEMEATRLTTHEFYVDRYVYSSSFYKTLEEKITYFKTQLNLLKEKEKSVELSPYEKVNKEVIESLLATLEQIQKDMQKYKENNRKQIAPMPFEQKETTLIARIKNNRKEEQKLGVSQEKKMVSRLRAEVLTDLLADARINYLQSKIRKLRKQHDSILERIDSLYQQQFKLSNKAFTITGLASGFKEFEKITQLSSQIGQLNTRLKELSSQILRLEDAKRNVRKIV